MPWQKPDCPWAGEASPQNRRDRLSQDRVLSGDKRDYRGRRQQFQLRRSGEPC